MLHWLFLPGLVFLFNLSWHRTFSSQCHLLVARIATEPFPRYIGNGRETNGRETLLAKSPLLLSYSKQSLNPIQDDIILIHNILIWCVMQLNCLDEDSQYAQHYWYWKSLHISLCTLQIYCDNFLLSCFLSVLREEKGKNLKGQEKLSQSRQQLCRAFKCILWELLLIFSMETPDWQIDCQVFFYWAYI